MPAEPDSCCGLALADNPREQLLTIRIWRGIETHGIEYY